MLRNMIIIKVIFMLIMSIYLVGIDNQKKEVKSESVSYSYQAPKEEVKKDVKPQTISRGGNINEETFELTFYTSLSEENGDYEGVTCNGSKLKGGMVANNKLPQGTKIITKEFGELTVSDRGGKNFNVSNRLDVFVPRINGESDRQYRKRVMSMGRVKVKGIIIK